MSLIRTFAGKLDFLTQSNAPLDTDGARPQSGPGYWESKVVDIVNQIKNPAIDFEAIPAIVDLLQNKGQLDDRKLLLEVLLSAMSRLEGKEISHKLQAYVITLLYKDLPHPVAGYVALPLAEHRCCLVTSNHTQCAQRALKDVPRPPVKYAFRSVDGSHYNPLFPSMGQARRPYARSVPSKHCLPKDLLPDAGLVFDTLLLRDKFEEHPGGISSLFFAFADLVIHSIFETAHPGHPGHPTSNELINNSSSYLDLSVLYGSTQAKVDSVRRHDGTGRLWNDVFADGRLLQMPPATCALLVLLSRNHNYIAQKILDINENGTYRRDIKSLSEDERKIQDEEIFQRTRLVNCGYFMHIILGDYVGAILGLVRDGSAWRLDPLMNIRSSNHSWEPVGEGNVVSVEFNLLYRWHATLSAEDTKWTEERFTKLFDGKDPKDVNINDFRRAAHMHMIPPADVRDWTFAGLKRGANGMFSDDDLANTLQNATEWRASAFKARGTPAAMRIIEIMSMEQARAWGTCTMNEFRKFVGLKPYKDFKEWNPNPEIYDAAQALYRDIDNLELYVGLQAEEAKSPGPGAGLCPGYTISRAILADAVCLTRGDRFFTTDFTPSNLTSWGFQDCQYDAQDGSYGGLLTKLLFRTLPNHYPRGSAYAHFPFMTPNSMRSALQDRDPATVDKYTWTRPKKQPAVVPVSTYAGVKKVLSDDKSFISASDTRLLSVTKPFISSKKLNRTSTWRKSDKRLSTLKTTDKDIIKAKDEIVTLILSDPASLSTYFAKKAQELITTKSFTSSDKQTSSVDIVRDVINLLPVHYIAEEIAGLPVKTSTNPQGVWYEHHAYKMFAGIGEYIHLNLSSENDWRLRETSQQDCDEIVQRIKAHLDRLDQTLPSFGDYHIGTGANHGHAFLKKALSTLGAKYSHREIAAHVFAATVPTAAIYSSTVAHVVDFFLEDGRAKEREEVVQLLDSKDAEAAGKLQGYIREAIRLSPPVPGVYRTAGGDVDLGTQTIQAFEVVYASLTKANHDENAFSTENFARAAADDDKTPNVLVCCDESLASEKFVLATVPAILKVIFRGLKDLRRAPSKSGRITSFEESYLGTPRKLYVDGEGRVSQFPDSLIVQFAPSS